MSQDQAPRTAAPAAAPTAAPAATANATATATTITPVPANPRRPALIVLTGAVLLGAAGYASWWALTQRHHETTDNAYVQAPVVQVTPQVGGTVLAVLADDTDVVQAGQPLVRLDAADARVALERAEAQLAQTVREVRTLYANNATLDATIQAREADVARMKAELGRLQNDLARAQDDLQRRKPLLASGAVSGEELQHAESAATAARSGQASAQSALAAAQAALAAAREQAAGNRVLTEGTQVASHPNVARAATAVREAWLAQQRTELPAPVSGQVARRNVQVGQRIAAGTPLMSLIPLEQVWVEANFKEGQLRQMRIGQPVHLTADLYGSQVEYHGKVAGMGAGTGAAFALLPAQNATGNWIKVVQRVPVRIELDARELAAHPLRVGLSMEATVDVAGAEGQPLLAASGTATPRASSRTQAFDLPTTAIDTRIQRIIAANQGAAGPARADKAPARLAKG
ncbi:HlyD family efflux transporter periplasmic adaptor subunit [Aquabacterium sp. OR-4]|uniref:HlyD family efflux transporter periplasmic adaptor subunit n=1 Tax=Aquabacterium sp. OR-4 TaxID=2978127 RepID=UPI0021B2007A|nr:HlyD family efflux transporter periplasmic adaptor subunit [Aquabacterium sp. OR-4]MDT7837110.1 HlyD family efflux transporter periplasmic adaptor subunit [Aquabacterium sp. OR-4]